MEKNPVKIRTWGYFHNPFSPFHSTVAYHTETSHLIFSANQLSGFYMMKIFALNEFSK